jgi:hypothetical protein
MSISIISYTQKIIHNFFHIKLNEGKLYNKIALLDAINNFVGEFYLIWNCLESQNIVLYSWILKYEN